MPAAQAATRLDPALHFRTLSTPHFQIYFHQGESALAGRLSVVAEDVWLKVGGALGVAAPRRTHVILADQSEFANGWATPLPYNTIFVTATAPAGSEFIGRNDDWLRLVFTHEFTHIVHLDRSEGLARVFRGVFGRTPIAFPNLWLPPWLIEGLAEWQESALTGDGRLHAGDFRAVEREAGLARHVEPLDRLGGGLTDWPGGIAPYAFGLGFHDYLAQRYGPSRFGELADVTAHLLPFTGTRAFGRVYGQRLGTLWRDYTHELEANPHPVALGVQPLRLTHHGHTVLGPRYLPPDCAACPTRVVYSVRNPDGFPSLQEIAVDGKGSRRVATRYLGSTATVHGDLLIFDQQEIRRNVGIYSDLYQLDRTSGRVHALTREQRLRDPDLSPDGRSLVCVRENSGRRDLVLVPWTSKGVGTPRVLASAASTHFDAPRWSPDGGSIVVARHRPGAQSEIVLVDPTSGVIRVLASASNARIVTPTWRPDGQAVVAAADYEGDTFNLYEFEIGQPPGRPHRLTKTTGGALWPDISPDGTSLVFVGYTVEGSDLFTLPYARATEAVDGARERHVGAAVDGAVPVTADATGTPYRPWATLPPRSWLPIAQYGDHLRAGVSVGGGDVLGRHAYVASADWLVAAPTGSVAPPSSRPDWQFAYAYDRWRPTLFASVSSRTLFSAGPPDSTGRPTPATVREREFEAGIFFPVRHIRASQRVVLSAVKATDAYTFPAERSSLSRTAARVGLSTSTAHVFGYSVSQERGVVAGVTAEFVRRELGSSANATTMTGDVRAYVPGLAAHQVVALRASGGFVSGRTGLGRMFLLGGGAPNSDVLDFGSEASSLMRGFPANSVAGRRVALLNAEYRFPLARPQRGFRTWPVFLHTLHASAFGDAGSAWTDRARARSLKTSLGGEISLDVVAGYSLPLTIAVGSAWGHDAGDGSNRATIYVRVGRAF